MEILEAFQKEHPGSSVNSDGNFVTLDGEIFVGYTEDELEKAAKDMIREVFETSYSDSDLSKFVSDHGYINFYDEVYINDFRIEDPDTFSDMSDEDIIEFLSVNGYFEDTYPTDSLDMDKMVDFVYDIDGYLTLDSYGDSFYEGGYTFIRIE